MTRTDDILGLAPGVGQVQSTVVFDLLDQYNSYLGDLDVIMDSAPSVENSINRQVKRTLSGLKLPPSVTSDIDTLRMRVRPWWVLETGDRFPLGVFLFADASRSVQFYGSTSFTNGPGYGSVTDGSMLDQLCTLAQGSRGINFYNVGASVQAAIEQQLQAGGVIDYEIEATDATIGTPIVWKPNTDRLDVINDLCRMGGYYSLYFDGLGTGQVRLVPSLEAAEVQRTYGPGGNVHEGTVVESDDLLNAPNSYVVVNTSFSEAPVWGEWLVPSSAPHSYANRGFYVVSEHDVQGVETNSAAARAAKGIGQADYATYRWLNFDTAPDPRHDTFDVIGWDSGETTERYREQQWSLRLEPNAHMKHELRRIWSEAVADMFAEAA